MIEFIRDIHQACHSSSRPALSFEFFPPKTEEGERVLLEATLPALIEFKPDYCSVTYGAGGGTREKTIGIVERIQREHDLTAMMHLTCVNASRQEIAQTVADARRRGIKNILALRGDPPSGTGPWVQADGGFKYSSELVAFLRAEGGFSIGTAGFPEGHISQPEGRQKDWAFLRDKINAGADFVITQLFFDNEDFYHFSEYMTRQLGVDVPIIPGIFPVLSARQTKKFTEMCGARLPESFVRELESYSDDEEAVVQFGIEYATRQCEALLKSGVPGLHFYTLNKAHSTAAIIRNLGIST